MSSGSGPRASYGTKKRNVPGVIFRAQAMYDGITGSLSLFGALPVDMAAYLALLTALVLAQQVAVETKARGAASLRDVKRDLVWTAMEALRVHIQGLADTVSAENACALIEVGGLLVGGVPTYARLPLTARPTPESGVVHLAAHVALLAGKDAVGKCTMFNWQWSANGTSWNDAGSTPYASTDITGLTPMTTYSFRVSVTVGEVTGPWSQPVSLLLVD